MIDWPDDGGRTPRLPTIHYSTSAIESVPACGKKGVPTTQDGDAVECKNCRRRFVEGKNGALYYDERWTQCCSGCCSAGESTSCASDCGSGCHECGYTGKRRSGFYAPINKAALIEMGLAP